MVVKISTGKRKGKTLASSDKARELRPTQSLVREAIFDILRPNVENFNNWQVLDLYAGLGSVGFEFLSNGVESVTFVDSDSRCIKLLRDNVRSLNYFNTTRIIKGVLPGALRMVARSQQQSKFDLIFADPPYKLAKAALLELIASILKYQLLKPGAILLLEYGDMSLSNAVMERYSEDLDLLQNKKYGESFLMFYTKKI